MSYTIKNLTETTDSAPKFGLDALGEPGKRQAFGHRHDEAEEIYVVLSGAGRVRLDDEIVEIKPLDAIRVEPSVTRAFEAGADGMAWMVFGAHHEKDGELDKEFWTD
jgi:mannose-6-phosphate isomerase-like protein (cupin superfamily)